MARHIEAWMDGVRLSGIGAIVIQDVSEPSADMEITYTNRPFRGGQGVQKRRRKSLRVTIHAAVHELFDLKKRNEIRQAIAKWCGGSVLELSNHPDQQLNVICKAEPGLGDVRDFNSKLDIELEADAVPYWEDKFPNIAEGTGSTGTESLMIGGTAQEIPVDVTFTPAAAVSSLSVTVACGGVTKQIALSGISPTVSADIVLSRDAEDRLQIKSGSTSLMKFRSAASADSLTVPAGLATVSWTASTSGDITFSARGRWL